MRWLPESHQEEDCPLFLRTRLRPTCAAAGPQRSSPGADGAGEFLIEPRRGPIPSPIPMAPSVVALREPREAEGWAMQPNLAFPQQARYS